MQKFNALVCRISVTASQHCFAVTQLASSRLILTHSGDFCPIEQKTPMRMFGQSGELDLGQGNVQRMLACPNTANIIFSLHY